MRAALFIALAVLAAGWPAHAAPTPRSTTVKAAFIRANPCPSTGKRTGACPGHVVDHVVPLCAGGADAPANMQWQTVDEAKAKDREERAQCRAARQKKSPRP